MSLVDLGDDSVGLGHRLVEVVVDRGVVDELGHAPLSVLHIIQHLVGAIDGRHQALVKRLVREELAERAAPALQIGYHGCRPIRS